MNNCKTSLPSNIDGVSGSEEISKLWQKHYYDLFNCFNSSNSFSLGTIENNEQVVATPQEVRDAVMQLADNKAWMVWIK